MKSSITLLLLLAVVYFSGQSVYASQKLENITTPANITRIYKKSGRTWMSLDYTTKMSAAEYASYALDKGLCTLPGMSKSQAKTFAMDSIAAYSASWRDGAPPLTASVQQAIDTLSEHCIPDAGVTLEFGITVNQSKKIRSFPLSSNFELLHACKYDALSKKDFVAATIKEIQRQITEFKKFGNDAPSVPLVTITNSEISNIDYVNGCAG